MSFKGFENHGYLMVFLEGLLVTFLWSTSYILIKKGLQELPPLTFAAYRYMLSSIILITATFFRKGRINLKVKRGLPKLFLLGLFGYSVAQGLQFLGLSYLPAVTVTFLLNFTPVIVLVFGMVFLKESPALLQVIGMIVALFGAYFYFAAPLSGTEFFGIIVTIVSGTGWAAYMVLSRHFLKGDRFEALTLTALSMFFGAVVLMISALLIEGPRGLSLYEGGIILWLSLVNTSLAFMLWNRALKRVKAFELSVLQNTMLIQIGILAWIFLGEALTALEILAMAIVFVGVIIVQIAKSKTSSARE